MSCQKDIMTFLEKTNFLSDGVNTCFEEFLVDICNTSSKGTFLPLVTLYR